MTLTTKTLLVAALSFAGLMALADPGQDVGATAGAQVQVR